MIGNRAWRLARQRRRKGLAPLKVSREEAIARATEAWGSPPMNGVFERGPSVEEHPEGWIVWMTAGIKPNRYVKVDGQTGEASGIWLEKQDGPIRL